MRLQVTPKHFAYLKISEGCDRLCTFCAIPKMRGKHASKPPEDILVEAKRLADNGVRELIIVAQDTTYYGIDMFGEPRLRQLLEELDQVEGLDWIRLMYFYPMYIDKALMSTIGQSKRILPYIDMPLQHINNTMLKRMSRRVTQESTVEMVSMMRETIPDLVLRTTMITGFPGETDEQFEDLVEFVDRMHFERLGVFTYSIEPDTPAARLDEARAAGRSRWLARHRGASRIAGGRASQGIGYRARPPNGHVVDSGRCSIGPAGRIVVRSVAGAGSTFRGARRNRGRCAPNLDQVGRSMDLAALARSFSCGACGAWSVASHGRSAGGGSTATGFAHSVGRCRRP
jgi:hypothetical protein